MAQAGEVDAQVRDEVSWSERLALAGLALGLLLTALWSATLVGVIGWLIVRMTT